MSLSNFGHKATAPEISQAPLLLVVLRLWENEVLSPLHEGRSLEVHSCTRSSVILAEAIGTATDIAA